MWRILKNRFKQGFSTSAYPKEEPSFPKRFRGKPILRTDQLPGDPVVNKQADATGAIIDHKDLSVDLGKLLFNEDIKKACALSAFEYSQDYRLAVSKKKNLIMRGQEIELASALNEKMKKIFGRSLKLREVCAGSCNGCDSEIQALNNIVFDLARFGIQFVASPRHADGLMITGPVTKNMELALKKTYDAVPGPKIVIAVGSCAISGGPFYGGQEVHNGVDGLIPVDLYIPGCPPHPLTILDGLLRLLDRIHPGRGQKE